MAHGDFEEKRRELRRARAQGLGHVASPPVALAVTRAMGDRDFKDSALLVARPSAGLPQGLSL